ncbi:MAG: MBL fold metallo-hydrolase [Alphaproteobacteria bacterium]|nr:MBL fold metallo-hydrolase [Alphaproteobacteria bacterium]
MSNRLIILGAGASPGVPSLSNGWGDCNPQNPKNKRLRTSVYFEYEGSKILIDASPDVREQLLTHQIKQLDGVVYTHAHGDHILGTDYLREINRITGEGIDIYAGEKTTQTLKMMFPYLVGADFALNRRYGGSLIPHIVVPYQAVMIGKTKLVPFEVYGHCDETLGYVFNDGEVVYIPDFKEIDERLFSLIKVKPKILILPLTTPEPQPRHAGLEVILKYIDKIGAERVIINHMATESDYDSVDSETPENVSPAFDNMIVEF